MQLIHHWLLPLSPSISFFFPSPAPSLPLPCPSPYQAMKYCHSRYLLLPTDCSYTLNNKEAEEARDRGQVDGFMRFFEFLNHLRRPSSQSRRSSTDSLASKFSRVTSRESLFVSSVCEREEEE